MTEENKYPPVNFDYAAGLAIDEHHLELELVSIAKDIMAVSEAFAQAIYDRNKAKEGLDAARANADSSIRTAAAAAQEKVTETVVANRVLTSPGYMEAADSLRKAEYVVDLLRGAVSAYQAKKTALENLVKLYGLKYYAEPYLPADSKAGVDAAAMDQGREAMSGELAKEMGPDTSGQSLPPRPGATTAPPTTRPPLLRKDK